MRTIARNVCHETWIIAVICMADLALTCWWVQTHVAQEGNPIMNFYLKLGIPMFVLMKMALVAFPLLILEWARRHRPEFVRRLARLTIAAYLGAYGLMFVRINVPTILHDDIDEDAYDTQHETASPEIPYKFKAPDKLTSPAEPKALSMLTP